MTDQEQNNSATDVQTRQQWAIIESMSIRNAKVVCFALILGCTLLHVLLHSTEGSSSCSRLFLDGRYENRYEWQPTGCMLHMYKPIEARSCLEKRKYFQMSNQVVFMGDSEVQKLQQTMSDILTEGGMPKSDVSLNVTYQNLPPDNARLEAGLQAMVDNPPSIAIVKGSIDRTASDAEQSASYFRTIVKNVREDVKTLTSKGTHVIWLLNRKSENGTADDYEAAYDGVVYQLLEDTGVMIWSSRPKITGLGADVEKVSWITQAETLLNALCNEYVQTKDGTCCKSPEDITIVQITFFAVMVLCVAAYVAMSSLRPKQDEKSLTMLDTESQVDVKQQQKQQQLYQLTRSLCSLSIILLYFFLCDRANFYMKENKHFSPLVFLVPFVIIMVLGFTFTAQSKFTTVLHRDQTDEWKGWMQLMILLYHMTGASKVIPIYMGIRLLVSSYLFLTGYGHFCFFWSKGDPSIVRFIQVQFRMNFLTVLLCLCMNRTYQFYYFVPLVSFWYIIVYLILVIPPHVTAVSTKANPRYYVYLILKFGIALGIISFLYYFEGTFEHIFGFTPWRMLFASDDGTMHEWRFRWELDRYSVLVGMVFAFLYMSSLRASAIDDSTKDNLFQFRSSAAITAVCIAVLCGFITFITSCTNKPECNRINEYIGYLPIISFILLRNLWGVWRCRFSRFFAWFGRISLELFIGQYHIWLAQDTYGSLVLVPGYPLINIVVTTFIFVFVAHEIHLVTGVVAPLAVPKELSKVGRNIAIFAILCIPIGLLRTAT